MSVTERVMALGDWSITLKPETPATVLDAITMPFGQIVIMPTNGFSPSNITDAVMLAAATYTGVCTRPGPQRELGGCSLAWYLGDETGGNGVYEPGWNFTTATTNASAVASALNFSSFTSGTISAGNFGPANYSGAQLPTRRALLDAIARNSNYEWRITPARAVSVGTAATLYGSTPTAVLVRSHGGRDVSAPFGIDGGAHSTWDWETYGSKAYVYGLHGYGSSGGASAYRDPAGNLMTIIRAFEQTDAPPASEPTIAAWWLSQINRTVRTVTADSTEFAVTGTVPCGGSVYLYDPDQKLYDLAVQVTFAGRTIHPVTARVQAVTWPVEKGMGVYYRTHDGTAATYVDLSDYVQWESPGATFELSTSAQSLAPPSSPPPLQTHFSPWQKYAAEWRGTVTNPAIGNGLITARFRRLGTSLMVTGSVLFGSTTTYGSGEWRVTLPPSCATTTTPEWQTGTGVAVFGVTGYDVTVWVVAGATELRVLTTGPAYITAAAPGGYVSTNYFTFDLLLEIQP